MPKKTYKIMLANGLLRNIIGYPVTIESIPDREFFVHRDYFHPEIGGWAVSDVATGVRIMGRSWPGGYSNKTRRGAVRIAEMAINDIGVKRTINRLKALEGKNV